jgi:hypothetical protein
MADLPKHPPSTEETSEAVLRCREIRRKIRKLQLRASRGIRALALFVAISIGAMNDFRFLPALPEHVRKLLGASPPVTLISIALVVYSFSAIILVLSRLTLGRKAHSGLTHVAYLTVFYGFYHFAGAMEDNFWAVFAAGMTILGLESYHNWIQCGEKIREEQKVLVRYEREKTSGSN